jgi:hypothetical protein
MDKKILFMRPFLDLLAQPRFFCRAVAITLRVMGALIVLFSLTTFFKAGKIIFDLPTNGILGGVLFEAFFLVAVYAAVHVFFIRARDIENLQSGGQLYAVPLTALLLKLFGEAYAAFVSFVAIGGGLFVWFTNLGLGKVLNPLVRALFPGRGDDPSFMGGIEFIASGVLIAIGVLVVSYALSELLTLLSRLAHNGAESRAADSNQVYRSRFGS